MKITDIKEEKEKVVCSIEMDSKEWASTIKKEKEKAAKKVKVPGFRAGKAPLAEAIKHVNIQAILLDAANNAIEETVKKLDNEEKLKKIDKEVFPTPSVEIGDKFDENEFAFKVVYYVVPSITIDNYKKLGVELKVEKVTDKMVDSEIDAILAKERMLSKKADGKIAKGNSATFDFCGKVDGVAFPGGTAEKFELEIGSGQFIPGFEDQMIGMKVGEEKDLKVTFPKEYHAENLAGKEAIFTVKVHEVNEINKPELNEDIIKGLNLPDKEVKTPAQFKKFLKENMEKYFEQRAYETNLPLVNKAIYDNAKVDGKAIKDAKIPEIMINEEKKEISRQFGLKLEQMGVKLEDFLKMVGKTKEDINNELETQAKQNVVVYGALDYIIDKEKITVSDKTIDERYEAIAKGYGKKVEEVKKLIEPEVLKESLVHEDALLKIMEWNK